MGSGDTGIFCQDLKLRNLIQGLRVSVEGCRKVHGCFNFSSFELKVLGE